MEDKKDDVAQPMTLLAVSFKEAALDSPTFRASMNHINEQFDSLDRWIDGFTKATLRLSQEMDVLQEIVNHIISRFVPDFVTQGLIDHDYTMLVMRRYAEAHRHFWAGLIGRVKSQSTKSLDSMSDFQRADLRSYKDSRRNFEAAQARYDNVLSRYASMSKTKEPSSLREDAFQVSEAKKAYIKCCFDLCCITVTVQRRLDTVLIDTMTDPWTLKKNSMVLADSVYQRLGVDMHRIKSWSKVVAQSLKPIEQEMLKARKEMEDQVIARAVPSRDLNDYTQANSTVSHFVPDNQNNSDEKHGWVFVKSSVKPARQVWVKRWAFVKNGIFGWLVLSPNKTFVQESDKIGVLLCNVSPEPNEDRRFCFEVRTKDTTLIMQAESIQDLKSWLQVFEVSKRHVIQQDRDSAMAYAFQRITPLIPEFASTQHTSTDLELTSNEEPPSTAASPTDDSKKLLQSNDAFNIQKLMTAGKSVLTGPMSAEDNTSFSAVGPFGSSLAPSPLINAPMPTGMTKEAIVANSFITPTSVPTAVTANYWGSVNWALYIKSTQLSPKIDSSVDAKGPNPSSVVPERAEESYPENYPSDLRAQDTQMRAIFQTFVDNDPMDRVVMVFRAMISPNSKQELPGRIFVTPRNLYFYCNCFGFSSIVKKPLSQIVSVEGHASTSWDTLYVVDDKGSSALCRVFLDSGRMIQKRMQYLADIKEGEEPSLETIIEKLKTIGSSEPKGDDKHDEDEVKQLLHKYLTYKPQQQVPKTNSDHHPALSIDLTTTMDQLILEKTFDIPAKAMFHLLFGENSTVFKYVDCSLFSRANLEVSPWAPTRSHMEREISFDFQTSGVLVNRVTKKRAIIVQRIEKMEENVYIVYDRRPPWELPHGGVFYLASLLVITAEKKNTCKFSIYSKIEWVKTDMTRNVVESLVFHHYGLECKELLKRVTADRAKLGKRGQTVTAIRMFGKLGRSHYRVDSKAGGDLPDYNNSNTDVSRLSVCRLVYSYSVGSVVSVVSWLITTGSQLLKALLEEFNAHKFIVLALGLSLLLNMYLSGKTSVAYWTEQSANRVMKDLASSSSTNVMKRSIYMSDIDDIIKYGEFAHDSNSDCYQKFRQLEEIPEDIDSDKSSLMFSRRITSMRNELGMRRNRLIVSLKTLNRLEQEALIAEWRRWLLSEINVCSLVRDKNMTKQADEYCQSCIEEWSHTFE